MNSSSISPSETRISCDIPNFVPLRSTLFQLITPLFQQTRLEKLYYFSTYFFETLHMWSSPPNATSDDRFFQNSSYFRFYGLFPVFISLISKKSQIRPIFTFYSLKSSVRPKHNFKKTTFGLGSNFKFGVI